MINDDYEAVADIIRKASATEVMKISCPTCGGSLKTQVSESSKRALSVMCKACAWRVVTDGLDELPPWVAELGRKIETEGSASVS